VCASAMLRLDGTIVNKSLIGDWLASLVEVIKTSISIAILLGSHGIISYSTTWFGLVIYLNLLETPYKDTSKGHMSFLQWCLHYLKRVPHFYCGKIVSSE